MTAAAGSKTIAFCILCFVASCLVTLTVRNSQFSSSVLPSWRQRQYAGTTQVSTMKPKIAFATFLAANTDPEAKEDFEKDGYFVGTRVLLYQLLYSKSAGTNHSIPFVVVCTTDVPRAKRDRLRKDGARIIVVDKLNADWVHPGAERWQDVLAKLRLWQLTEYQKILFIDADHLVTAPLDGVFYDESTLTAPTLTNMDAIKDDEAALPRTYMFATHADYWGYDHAYPPPQDADYLNCGFFIFTPSITMFNYYMSLLKLEGRFSPTFPEQNLLNYAHRKDGNMPWKPLWYGWNVNWPTAKDWRGGARSFHAKYWDGADTSHDPVLLQMWERQKSEMEGFWRGREIGVKELRS